MVKLTKLIKESSRKFNTNLSGKIVLTEAATGNYVCTPILAALAGAKVYAIAKDSGYGTINQIQNEIFNIARQLKVQDQINLITNFSTLDLEHIDIVTNTGFVRPIDKLLIDRLKPDCVIPLMWEPWEYRPGELDLDRAIERGIKVYGTNESDPRLQTMLYIGMTVLYFLLKEKIGWLNSRILIIGCERFMEAIDVVLKKNNYSIESYLTSEYKGVDITKFNAIIVAEHTKAQLIIGNAPDSLISSSMLTEDHLIIHISGNVDFKSVKSKHYPNKPASFGYMSYTTDFIDPSAVIDLHAAGLKVAEGMLKAKKNGLKGFAFKKFLETNYPAMAFKNKKYW